jgi:hypothetical protein
MAKKSDRGTEEAWRNRRHKPSDRARKKPSLPRLKFLEKEMPEEENIPADKHKKKPEQE